MLISGVASQLGLYRVWGVPELGGYQSEGLQYVGIYIWVRCLGFTIWGFGFRVVYGNYLPYAQVYSSFHFTFPFDSLGYNLI